ncbi:MAG: protein AroM [Gammaproteobacteria bacterium]|jgi:protein AroM
MNGAAVEGRTKVGALVIGQSPRPDVIDELRAVLGDEVEIDLRGALDGLARDEIARLPPRNDADALFTHLPDGTDATISKAAVIEHGEATLAAMTDEGFRAVIVMCTGAFPGWMERYRVVFPSLVLDGFVGALARGGKLGVLVPLQEQIEPMRARWQAQGFEPEMGYLRPTSGEEEIDSAAMALGNAHPDLVVYDCLSYGRATKRRVEAAIGVPGVLAVSAAARAAQELMSGSN